MHHSFVACAIALTGACASSWASDEQAQWLRQHAAPLAGFEAGAAFDDLEAFGTLVGDARVVALGECTHGSREVFQMKHRLVEYLAKEQGFTIFSIEANMPECRPINDYVHGAAGNVVELIRQMYFWTWSTESVRDMVEWMRMFNAEEKTRGTERSIDFTGMDMQVPDFAMRNVLAFLEAHDTEEHARVRATYERALSAGGKSKEYAATANALPVDDVRGHRVTYSGQIKTSVLVGGHAGLWMRIDGPDGPSLGFENMNTTGPRGDTEWTSYEIALDVPEEAVGVVVGLIVTGRGDAWFDDLSIRVGMTAYEPEGWEPSFETGPGVFTLPTLRTYELSVTDNESAVGEKSLFVHHMPLADGSMTAVQARDACAEVSERLRKQRGSLAEAAGAEACERMLRDAEVVRMCMASRADSTYTVRDRSMAENVLWMLERNPEARIVLWAHSGHNAKGDGRMGNTLHEALGEDYISVAFATGGGTYTAAKSGEGIGEHPLMEPPVGSYDEAFAEVGHDLFLLDLREAEKGSPGSGWFHEATPWRAIGAIATENQYFNLALREWHDAVIWIGKTTASKPLR